MRKIHNTFSQTFSQIITRYQHDCSLHLRSLSPPELSFPAISFGQNSGATLNRRISQTLWSQTTIHLSIWSPRREESIAEDGLSIWSQTRRKSHIQSTPAISLVISAGHPSLSWWSIQINVVKGKQIKTWKSKTIISESNLGSIWIHDI